MKKYLFMLLIISQVFYAGELIDILEENLNRSFLELKNAGDAELYYLAYNVTDVNKTEISASQGALYNSDSERTRTLDIDLRVGTPHRDNTHEIRTSRGSSSYDRGIGGQTFPLENNNTAISEAIWLSTDEAFKDAQEKYRKVMGNLAVKVEEEDTSGDFSLYEPVAFIGEINEIDINTEIWNNRISELSKHLTKSPVVINGTIKLLASNLNKYFVNSEGSRIIQSQNYVTLSFYINGIADDGMGIERTVQFTGDELADMPDDDFIISEIERLIDELEALSKAPVVEPFTGPAILVNRASGVFFHEIFGHRIEGHRQKSESDGQTFSKKLDQKILPEFLSVYDDPSQMELNGEFLRGYYNYDDEGIKGSRADVVVDGYLKTFLMSRAPLGTIEKSNGHGRRAPGARATSRQANLFVESKKTMPFTELREMLIEEIKKQDKPYGLIFQDISGGFTRTGRYGPQSFKVQPLLVYRVYPDGREDEVVRGVDIVGTPLTSFSQIIATADDYAIFNGSCGAESGFIPVSAVSPSILVSQIEVEKKMKGQDKPPILPAPPYEEGVQP